MGCLNYKQAQPDWKRFANIHLSGPCNRSCYFCIGQHMMALDHLNNLAAWPLKGIQEFTDRCVEAGVAEINLTGTNTEPLLYEHHDQLVEYLRFKVPGVKLGIRSNGVLATKRAHVWRLYDKASVSVTSLDPELYRETMGSGSPPDIAAILAIDPDKDVKVNVVLCPETVGYGDVFKTLDALAEVGVKRVNLREPYGQPHIGVEPLKRHWKPFWTGGVLGGGVESFDWDGMEVAYWDVHYVPVESINLYASGRISTEYPVTKGHHEHGFVQDQSQFERSGRVRPQWVGGQQA